MDFLNIITSGAVDLWGLALICALLFLSGFVDAIAGGGGFISVPAYLFAGVPVHAAIATNKLSSCMGTTIATIKYIREGYMIWWLVIPCVVFALFGGSLGARLSLAVDELIIEIIMLFILPIAAYYVLRNKRMDVQRESWSKGKTMAICFALAFVIGMYDGFYGPGTGTFLMLLLPLLGHLSLDNSAGLTKAINLTTNVSSMVVFLVNGAVLVPLGLTAGIFNIIGAYLGARAYTSKGAAVVRPIMMVVLVLFAIRLISDLSGVL